MINFVEIGELVSIPSSKLIGKVSDKVYEWNNDDKLQILVFVDCAMTRKVYGGFNGRDKIFVTYDDIKSMKSTAMYNSKIIPSNIPNILTDTKKDLKKGNVVKVVDNHMLESFLTHGDNERLYNLLWLSELLGRVGVIDEVIYKPYSSMPVIKCKFECKRIIENNKSYYIYMDCLQLVKRTNIFIQTRRWFLRIIKKIDNFLERIFFD
jgi:hypothetical protein